MPERNLFEGGCFKFVFRCDNYAQSRTGVLSQFDTAFKTYYLKML